MLNSRESMRKRISHTQFTASTSQPVYALSDVISSSHAPSRSRRQALPGANFPYPLAVP
ncbi:hypothetical protein BD410DRAFT_791142 [Rickenella mellea]|uniref:Uncharacterized protein n=1 Tax=Rickenella mellea TaxID=50990 RepID=A0A4Y7PZM1_9AGAM|nr:hypothetical protein BD410DRAFT_791142 [Rickenella mellea]